MGARVYNKLFDPSKDSLTIRGDFQVDAGAASDWGGFFFKMTRNVPDTTYSVTINLPSAKAGTLYSYKFVQGPDKWENVTGGGNRSFTLAGSPMVLPIYWFSDDSTYNPVSAVTNTFNFTADISAILGSGAGYFDPSIDSLQVAGLDWDGHGTFISGNRTMLADPSAIGKYTAKGLVVKGMPGDSCRWKFKASPEAHFMNNGYELGGNRYIPFQKDNAVVDLPIIVPNIKIDLPTLTSPCDILFECNLLTNPPARNAKNNRLIPIDSVYCIGIKGGVAPLGSWGGSWLPADTGSPNPTMIVMYDNGLFGDQLAGDKVYSRLVTFPAGTTCGYYEYKCSAIYPAALSDGGNSTPLDNEGAFGLNHYFELLDNGHMRISFDFGFTPGGIKNFNNQNVKKFELSQNYPNPFNPTTNIRFSVPVDGNVVMKIYNVMGQEVATLVNEYVKAGAKEVTFNASSMPSGMYVYSIKAGSFSATRKMMVLK